MTVLKSINTVKADCDNMGSSSALLQGYRFHANDSRLYTRVGKRTAREIVSTGKAGCLLFGPYIPIDAGEYRVVVYGEVGELGAGRARVDVSFGKGKHILAESAIGKPCKSIPLAGLSISLKEPCRDLEVRVWVGANSQVTISMVDIQPSQTCELEAQDQLRPEACINILPQNKPPRPRTQQIEAGEPVLTIAPHFVHRSDFGSKERVGRTGMIALENVTKVYDTRRGPYTVLDDINLQVARGEKIGILGRNGAGKSTLLRIISGAELPTSGQIQRDMSISWPLAFGGGFQGTLTGLDNLRFICRVYGTDFESVVPFVEEFSELGSYLHEPVKKYSSGMRARLAFALSMAVDFDCFLIDEIIAVGDSRFHGKCRKELFDKRKDRAMILVSHSPEFIRGHCDRAAVLLNGKLHKFNQVDEALKFYQEHSG